MSRDIGTRAIAVILTHIARARANWCQLTHWNVLIEAKSFSWCPCGLAFSVEIPFPKHFYYNVLKDSSNVIMCCCCDFFFLYFKGSMYFCYPPGLICT